MSARRQTLATFEVVEVMVDHQTEFVTGEKVRLVLRENGDVTWARVREAEGDS